MTFKQLLSINSAPTQKEFPDLIDYMIGLRLFVALCYGVSLGYRSFVGGMGLVFGGSLM